MSSVTLALAYREYQSLGSNPETIYPFLSASFCASRNTRREEEAHFYIFLPLFTCSAS